jgi:hypothetical protein
MTKKGQRVKLKKHRKLKMSINGTYQNPGKMLLHVWHPPCYSTHWSSSKHIGIQPSGEDDVQANVVNGVQGTKIIQQCKQITSHL